MTTLPRGDEYGRQRRKSLHLSLMGPQEDDITSGKAEARVVEFGNTALRPECGACITDRYT